MLHYDCKDLGLLCWNLKTTVVKVVLVSLKHNRFCEQAISSSQLCSQSILCTNFCAHVTQWTVHAICEGLN